jgi:hypothetical protein
MDLKNKLYEVQMVLEGKRIPIQPPQPIFLTNADFIRGSKQGLYALHQIKNEYVDKCIYYNHRFPESLSKEQIKLLTSIFKSVDTFLNRNPLIDPTVHKITKALRKEVSNLGATYRNFNGTLNKIHLPAFLDKACKVFIGFTIEFVETFNFIDGLIDDIRKIPNRTPDCELRILLDKVIVNYQKQKNTTEYPKYPYVLDALNSIEGYVFEDDLLPEIKLSARHYGNFKKWRDRGTYWWYIQP